MEHFPLITPKLAERIERFVVEEKIAESPSAKIRKFGEAVALKNAKSAWMTGVYCFGERDVDCLEKILAFYRTDNVEPIFYVGPMGFAPEVSSALSAAGFQQTACAQTLLCGVPAPTPRDTPGISIEEVDEHNIEEFVETTAAGFDWPAEWREGAKDGLRQRLGQKGFHPCLARIDGEVVGVAVLYAANRTASLGDATYCRSFDARVVTQRCCSTVCMPRIESDVTSSSAARILARPVFVTSSVSAFDSHTWNARGKFVKFSDPMTETIKHLTTEQLEASLPALSASPKDNGVIEMIVRRPRENEREVLQQGELDLFEGLAGDTWNIRGSSRSADGSSHPDMQLNIMSSRVIALVAQEKDRWPLAGDQLFVDLDLSEENLPPWTKLAIGSAIIQVTDQPHTGCKKFVARFGLDAMNFVNSPIGKRLHLRGINAKVVTPGTIRVGDVVRKV